MKSQRNNTLELNEPTTEESKLIDLPFEKVGTLKCNKVLKRYKHQILKSQRTKGQIPSENLKLLPASEHSGALARRGLYLWPLFPSHISSHRSAPPGFSLKQVSSRILIGLAVHPLVLTKESGPLRPFTEFA